MTKYDLNTVDSRFNVPLFNVYPDIAYKFRSTGRLHKAVMLKDTYLAYPGLTYTPV